VKIDIWSDVACPWCYIGKRRFEKALTAFPHRDHVTVRYHSYQLDPGLPEHYDGTELEYLASRKGMPESQVVQMFRHVSEQATGEGLHYDFENLQVANSLRAHQLLHLAKRYDVDAEVKESLLSAHFEHGKDIGDEDTLVTIGTGVGVPEQEIREELATGALIPAVQADVEEATALGIRAVPTYVLEMTFAVSGAQSPDVFAQALQQAWLAKNPLVQLGDESTDQADACGPDGCA
jgi:predicted DsbA family dithiol-disulfide isomerase